MSHFSRVATKICDLTCLIQAMDDLGLTYETGEDIVIHGHRKATTLASVRITTQNPQYDIGLVENGDAYELVAEWWGIKETTATEFVARLTQRYAYHAAVQGLRKKGFRLKKEAASDGTLQLTFSKWS